MANEYEDRVKELVEAAKGYGHDAARTHSLDGNWSHPSPGVFESLVAAAKADIASDMMIPTKMLDSGRGASAARALAVARYAMLQGDGPTLVAALCADAKREIAALNSAMAAIPSQIAAYEAARRPAYMDVRHGIMNPSKDLT